MSHGQPLWTPALNSVAPLQAIFPFVAEALRCDILRTALSSISQEVVTQVRGSTCVRRSPAARGVPACTPPLVAPALSALVLLWKTPIKLDESMLLGVQGSGFSAQRAS